MQIIPAIDIIDGKCVRLTRGDYSQKKIYNEKPLEVALQFEEAGIKRLHLVDLDGAKSGAVKNWKVLENIAAKTKLMIDFGGGIKTDEELKMVFNSGAALATVGTLAVSNEELLTQWVSQFGGGKFLLGADVIDAKIAVNGWTRITNINVFDFIENYTRKGVHNIFCTDIKKDGMLGGPSVELYKRLLAKFKSLSLIASGGVNSNDDIEKLKTIGCRGVIIGKALYEGKIRLWELKPYIDNGTD